MGLIFLGLIVAYNPWYLHYLMANSAIGGMSIRTWTGAAFLFVLILARLFAFLRSPQRFSQAPLSLMMRIFVVFSMFYIVKGLIYNTDRVMVIADSFPLVEFFVLYYAVRSIPAFKTQAEPERMIRWAALYFLIMGITDVLSYFYLTFVQGLSFGALRADIGGTVVNRLMDFIIPIFAPIFLFYRGAAIKRKWLLLLNAVLLMVVMLTFFRTIYVTFLVTVGYLIFKESKKALTTLVFSGMVLFALFAGVYLVEDKLDLKYGGENISTLTVGRLTTIFSEYNSDFAITSRLSDNQRMLDEIPEVVLLGRGTGAMLDEETPVQFTSNYFLQLVIILGLPGGLLFIAICLRAFWVAFRMAGASNATEKRMFYLTCSSLILSLAVIFNFFPYTVYFPLLYILGAVFGLVDRSFINMPVATQKLDQLRAYD